jgi:plasmid stability protein
MPQLIVREIEDKVVRKLKARAGLHGVSAEEEHRRILREVLLGNGAKRPSFKDHLLKMPNAGPDNFFERKRDKGRKIDLSRGSCWTPTWLVNCGRVPGRMRTCWAGFERLMKMNCF